MRKFAADFELYEKLSYLTKLVILMLLNNVMSNVRQMIHRLDVDIMDNAQQNEIVPITCGIVNSIKDFTTKRKKRYFKNLERVTKEAMISACTYTTANKARK